MATDQASEYRIEVDDAGRWYALFRRPYSEVQAFDGVRENMQKHISSMVVAWGAAAQADAEILRYVLWDQTASKTAYWCAVFFPRRPRESYTRTFERGEESHQLLEYHWVWEDLEAAAGAKQIELMLEGTANASWQVPVDKKSKLVRSK
jgi:hypothetical protein